MKRFLSIFICVALLGGLLVPVLGEAEDGRTLYVRGPLSWKSVYLWTNEGGEIFGSMPGTKMSRDGFTYCLTVPNDLTTFTLMGNGTDLVGPISADPDEDLYVTVDEDGTAEVQYGGYEGDESTDQTDTRTVTIKPPDSWTTVDVFTWDPEDLGEFPGSPAQKAGDIYWLTVKKSTVNLVISGARVDGSRMQTDSIMLDNNGRNVTVEVGADATVKVTYEGESTPPGREPVIDNQGEPSNYRVVGNADWMGYWRPDNDLGIMYEVELGVYRKTFYDVEPGNYELKITKDGQWEGAYGAGDGNNFNFTVDQKCNITVTFTLKNGVGVIEVYGTGEPNMGDDDPPDSTGPGYAGPNSGNSSSSGNRHPASSDPNTTQPTTPNVTEPQVTQPADPGVTNPQVTQPSTPSVMEPQVTRPSASGSTKPQATQPADPGVTDPQVTLPTDPAGPDTPVTRPTTPAWTKPTFPDVLKPAKPNSTDSQTSPLINQPMSSGYLFLFGILAVCMYLLFLLLRRNQYTGDVTPDGKVRRRTWLSAKAVTRAVKETMPAPSAKLDEAVLEAIKNAKQPPTEP